jgi:hypothetical protein
MYDQLTYNDLIKIIEEYQHRIAMIKDDVNAIYKCIELDSVLSDKMSMGYGNFVPDVCLHNIDIACDLSSDDCLEWSLYTCQ